MKSYRIVIEMDDNGWWFVDAPDVPGAHSQGQTLARARANIRETIALMLNLPEGAEDTMEVIERIELPGNLAGSLQQVYAIRSELERLNAELGEATSQALAYIDKYLGDIGLRDKADLLGVSFQRVQQLQPGAPRRGRRAAPASA
ncbi:MAG: type II toxin-antitoxin system HicB family antitoxin [Acidimicrobiia bacterium]